MDEGNGKRLKEALKSNESFLDLLKRKAESGAHHALKGPHPTREMLYDYVLNWTDDMDDENIMAHIGSCSICSKEVLSIMKLEQELEDGMLEWANKQPLVQRLKNLISGLSLPVYGFATESPATRAETSEKKREYTVGESMVLCVPVAADGYLVILHHDTEGRISMVFPGGPKDDNFVRGGSEKKISGRITGPPGKQFFKVIWTSRKLLAPATIDFNDDESVEISVETFLDALEGSDTGEWIETGYDIVVTEGQP